MKKLFIILAAAMMFCSCTSVIKYTYYQVYQAKPVNTENMATTQDGIKYEDENCVIKYYFWAEEGNANFSIYNKTDKVLCIDMNKSFFVQNGHAFNYYIEPQTLSEIDTPVLRPIISIPPKAFRTLQLRHICQNLYVDCDLDRFPKEYAERIFEQHNSPIQFKYYLTYNFGDGTTDNVIDNAFYISSVTNIAEPSIVEYQLREMKPCKNLTNEATKNYKTTYPEKVYDKIFRINTSDCFYLIYDKYSTRRLYGPFEGDMLMYNEFYKGYTERH